MILVGLFSWWYGVGWLEQAGRVRRRLARVSDYFSLLLLLKTLFAPFRQIAAGQTRGSLSDKLRAWLDRLVSRLVGASVRLIVFCLGLVVVIAHGLAGLIVIALWPVIPLFPLFGLILAMIGWTPVWT